MSKYIYNKDYFEIINSEDKAYWLGFLQADGCITRFYKGSELRSMSLEVTLSEKDKEHLEKFNHCLESNVPIKEKSVKLSGKQYKSFRLVINCTKLCYDLINLGCTPQKTYTIKFPNEQQVPKKFIRDFLRGFFDGDGCISITTMCAKPHIVTKITGMKDMLLSISDYLLENQIICTRPSLDKDKRRECVYDLSIYGTDTNKDFLSYLYDNSNVYLSRKYNSYIDFYDGYDYKNNKRGVYYDKSSKTYIANIYQNGKRKILGKFKNIDDAILARKQAEIKKTKNCPLNQ